MAQFAIATAGAVVGNAILPGIGGQIGWAVGAAVGAQFGPTQQGPHIGDLSAPKLNYGDPWYRVYGTLRVPCNPLWASDVRETGTESGGKGGGPSVETFTGSGDLLMGLAIDSPVVAIVRVWRNKELVWSRHADSPSVSTSSEWWDDLILYDGSPSQLPDPTYEAAVGIGNAPAYRHRATAMFKNAQFGASNMPPLFEVEVTTAASTAPARTRLESYFDASSEDISAYALGAGSLVGSSIGVAGGALSVDCDNAAHPSENNSLTYEDAALAGDGSAVTVEFIATWIATPNIAYTMMFEYVSNVASPANYSRIGWIGPSGNMIYDDNGFGAQWVSPAPVTDRVHCAMVFGATSLRVYVGGIKVYEAMGDNRPGAVASGRVVIGNPLGYSSGITAYTVDEFAVRFYEQYSADFTPPEHIDPPDGFAVAPQTVTLASIFSAELLHAGYDAAEFDATALESVLVAGYATSDGVRAALEQLASLYYVQVECTDKLYFTLRGGASIASIPFDDLGAGVDNVAAEPFEPERGNEDEVPAAVALTVLDPLKDYASATQQSDRLVGTSTEVRTVQIPISMPPTEAKGRVTAMALDNKVASNTYKLAVTDYWPEVSPTGVIHVVDEDGTDYRLRVVRMTYADGVRQLETVLDDPSVLLSAGITTETDDRALTVRILGDTELLLLDVPIMRDSDDDAGFYAALKPATGTTWRTGASLNESLDGVTYTQDGLAINAAVFGTASTILGNWTGGAVFDETNTVTVDVGDGTLSSSTRDAIIADPSINVFVVGSEVINAVNCTLVTTGIYILSRLLRGRRGTDWASTGHAAGERVWKVGTAGTLRVDRATAQIGVTYDYKAVTGGRSLSTATAQAFTDTAIGLKPFAPVDLRKDTSDPTRIRVTAKRRTRLAASFIGSVVPLGEASESYDWELRDGSSVLISSSTTSVPEWSGATGIESGSSLVAPAWGMTGIGGEIVAVRDDVLGTYTTTKYLQRFASDGSSIALSPALGQEVYQWCHSGDQLFAATAEFNLGTPVTYKNSKIQRLDRTAIGSVAATYTAGTPGDLWGIAHDGTNVWASEYYSGNLRKLNATTLASVSTYAVNAGITALQYLSGDLWIASSMTDEVVQWDIGSTSETQRFSVVGGPGDIVLANGLVFVLGASGIGVYQQSDGSEVATYADVPPVVAPQRCMCLFGSYVAIVLASGAVLVLDAATGLESRRFACGHTYLFHASGESGGELFLTVGGPGESARTVGYALAAANLAGHTLTVWQRSATVGRGYPASLAL